MENHKEMKIKNILKECFSIILLSMPCCVHAFSMNALGKLGFIEEAYTQNIHQQDTVLPQTINKAAAKIDMGSEPEYILPDDPEIPISPILDGPISKPNYTVGTPKGVLNISNSGAAAYSLNIDVPNGGSLTPQIGLSYNSQSCGYGLVGYGFNITGISAITRGGHDLFHDGKQSGVTYTANDNLFLDGKRLILQSGTSCQDGATYTVEGDPFTKVVAHGNYNNSTTTT